MPPIVGDATHFLGFLLRALGFLVFGFAAGRFVFDAFSKSEWQVKIALALGLFGLLIGITDFSTAGSAGAFALGAGGAYFASMMPSRAAGDTKK
ncbi:MAG TPA: hypothetical protein VHM28_01595 [Anaerolineales bacterium]|jgi:hypothetical protein|nr:hypothetical protein [Anaerolineales bacterium]